MQSKKTIIPVLNEKLCNFFTILSFVSVKNFFIAEIPEYKRYFFFLYIQGKFQKIIKKYGLNRREKRSEKSERSVFCFFGIFK
jgi:uncharacterized membrane protein YdjX (TVP38/TMEM64 family)